MTEVTAIADGYGGTLGDRNPMPAKPGSHSAYAMGSDVVVEWYDFGPDAPYESANLLIFDRAAQFLLAAALGLDATLPPHMIANRAAGTFDSYFAVKAFATEQGIPFRTKVDFAP